MKEKVFQSMYQQIHLNNRQKQKVWAGLEEEAGKSESGRQRRLTLRGAVLTCAVLVASGITVLAANPTYVERIAESMHFYGGSEKEVTPEERALYEAYGREVEYTWDTAAGTVDLGAVLYDGGCVCIPFTLYPNIDLTPGTDLKGSQTLFEILGDLDEGAQGENYHFRIKGRPIEDLSYYTQLNPVVEEDGSLTGSYFIQYIEMGGGGLVQGDVIEHVNRVPVPDGVPWGRVLMEGESTEGLTVHEMELNGESVKYVVLIPEYEVLTEILLDGMPLQRQEISTEGIQMPYGCYAETIEITPLALYMYGTREANSDQYWENIYKRMVVVLNDGTVIGHANTGGSIRTGEPDENGVSEISMLYLFSETINPDEVAGISITDGGEEIFFIPAQ